MAVGQKKKGAKRSAPATAAADAPNRWFELRRSGIQGTGAFAVRRIPRGTRIIEYTGQRISQKEADRRYDDEKMKRHHTFLFALDNGRIIDAAVGGNEARFINHSCDPNCDAIEEDDRIFIEATRTIAPGQELAYDYAYDRGDVSEIKGADSLYVCRCGSARCRGTILAPLKEKTKAPARKKNSDARAKKKQSSATKRRRTRATTKRK